MRRSLMILFLALLLLLSLTGCGTSATTETTVPPTEVVSFFEEQGLQTWEGFTVETDPDVREIHAKAELPNIAELYFYKGDIDPVTEILHKEIVEGTVEVHIAAYTPHDFEMEYISDVVESFYQKAVEEGETTTKDEWLAAHEDYVVYNCWTIEKANEAKHIDDFLAGRTEAEYSWSAQMSGLLLMDEITGTIYYPHNETSGIIEKFPLTVMRESAELFAVYSEGGYEHNSETSKYRDFGGMSNMFVMVPKAYNGLVFVYDGYATNRTDAELLADVNDIAEEETSKWGVMPYAEYQEKKPHLTQYFFSPADWSEEDNRFAPAAGNFFDRMGINANMEKFEITETVTEAGVKETHWKTTTSIPGAEMHYFNAEKKSAKSYVDKQLANCTIDAYCREYPADQFSSPEIRDVIQKFYEADNAEITNQQWHQEHQDYKLMHFTSKSEFWAGHCTSNFFSSRNGQYWWRIYTNWNKLIDRYTGVVFMPQSGSDGVVEDFEVNGITFSVMNTQESEWYQPVTRYKNYRKNYDMYILVPADYDGLIYSLVLYEENRSDEDIFELLDDTDTEETKEETETEEETSTWWSGNFYDEEPHLKRYYFIPAQ